MEKSKIELLLDRLDLKYEEYDVKELNKSIDLLIEYNLSNIVNGLLETTKSPNFFAKLTEVNFTVQLIKSFSYPNKLNIQYEPNHTRRPIDLVIKLNDITYFIQIKSLSSSMRENKQSQAIREIRRRFQKIPSKRGLMIHVNENFSKDNVDEFIQFINENLDKGDEIKLRFSGSNEAVAELEFKTPKKDFREHLTLYSFGDLDAVNVTGITRDQVKAALIKASGAFEQDSSDKNINLIVSEIRSDRMQAIDFAEALYGTEYSTFEHGKVLTHRNNDGLFLEQEFAKKISGIVVLHRKNDLLSSFYERAICCNPLFDYLRPITDLIHEKIIQRYTWIDGGFFDKL